MRYAEITQMFLEALAECKLSLHKWIFIRVGKEQPLKKRKPKQGQSQAWKPFDFQSTAVDDPY